MRRLPLERFLPDFATRDAMQRYFPTHGLKQRAPQRSRSSVLRVTTVKSCCKLVAAIRLSMTGNGWPRASDAPAAEPIRKLAPHPLLECDPLGRIGQSGDPLFQFPDRDDTQEQFIFVAFEYPADDRRLRSWAHQLGNDAGVQQPAHSTTALPVSRLRVRSSPPQNASCPSTITSFWC